MDFRGQILDISIKQISSLKECAEVIIVEITRTDPTNGFPLKDYLIELFAKAETYDILASSSRKKMSRETHTKLHSKVTVQLGRAKAKEELTWHLQNLEEKLQSIEYRKKVLQQELIDWRNKAWKSVQPSIKSMKPLKRSRLR